MNLLIYCTALLMIPLSVFIKLDMNINTSDTTSTTIHEYIYQVNSSTNKLIYYYTIRYRSTTPLFHVCRIMEYLYKPRVKMRDAMTPDGCVYIHVFYTCICTHVLLSIQGFASIDVQVRLTHSMHVSFTNSSMQEQPLVENGANILGH
jgi:hypothetical protein